ncbi:MAG: prepilin-type N-terminal cleavage/methylation domain-containing protein [Hyphomicrobium aestuarii]|nr:prepilin-type N-terminal cleavage/methylation domain-containing protein [Hyphomicrobium aestuarii]
MIAGPIRRQRVRDSSHGFSLIEMLVALVFLAAAIGIIADVLGLGWRGIKTSAGETAALAIAERELSGAGILWPLAAGRSEGTDGNHTFVVEARPVEITASDGPKSARRVYRVTVQVRWPDGRGAAPRRVSLSTYKLGPLDDGARP